MTSHKNKMAPTLNYFQISASPKRRPGWGPQNDQKLWEIVGFPGVLLDSKVPSWGAPWGPDQGAGGPEADCFL